MEHFGVRLINKGQSFHLVRDEFAIINTKPSLPRFESLAKSNAYCDETGGEYTENWCTQYRTLCLKNFDLNMEYFSKLSQSEFDTALSKYLSKYKHFKEVQNLNDYSGIEGYYVMVLDKYKQIYIGKSDDIKRRILTHWSNTKPFDRTLYPMYAWTTSVFSIDFFRALDTTRIFAWKKILSLGIEEELVSSFPKKFCTNRIGGDVTHALQAINTTRQKQLI